MNKDGDIYRQAEDCTKMFVKQKISPKGDDLVYFTLQC